MQTRQQAILMLIRLQRKFLAGSEGVDLLMRFFAFSLVVALSLIRPLSFTCT